MKNLTPVGNNVGNESSALAKARTHKKDRVEVESLPEVQLPESQNTPTGISDSNDSKVEGEVKKSKSNRRRWWKKKEKPTP